MYLVVMPAALQRFHYRSSLRSLRYVAFGISNAQLVVVIVVCLHIIYTLLQGRDQHGYGQKTGIIFRFRIGYENFIQACLELDMEMFYVATRLVSD